MYRYYSNVVQYKLYREPGAAGQLYAGRDTVFHGRMVPAGSVVIASPADNQAA